VETDLYDTKFFLRRRISFSDLPPGESIPGNTRLPMVGFRREMGFFYAFQDLQEMLIRHLDTKPERPKQQELFVWTLKEDAPFGSFSKEYAGKEDRVPWWIIKPILRWQQSGVAGSVIPTLGATFFMEAHVEADERQPVGVSLSLNCSSFHSEWYLQPAEITMKTRFQKGNVFLSVV